MTGPVFVDHATTLSGIKKDAVAIGEFNEAFSNADFARVLVFEFLDIIEPERLGEPFDFRFVDPHVARCTGTAITALSAFESKSIGVPGSGIRVLFRFGIR